ncbi:MAG: class I SAM-dependent methyltransferase [Candidatus Omnitrophica bacterium]|nr:class I SAM-dependent methyltransferase [Candidatus Omnitrophota bacterium]
MQTSAEKYHKDTAEFIDKMVANSKETMGIPISEQIRIRNDSLLKIEDAPSYIEFFKKNISSDIKNKKILEFGSGQGIVTMEFSKAGAEVTGIDIDKTLVDITQEFAHQKGLNTKFITYSNNKRVPLEDNHFDYIYSIQTFEHLDDPVYSLRELCRVLKKRGILHLTFPNRFYPYDDHAQIFLIPWLPYKVADLVTKLCRKHNMKYYANLHFYSYWQFKKILIKSKADFSIIKKINSSSYWKKSLIGFLHKCNIHHTVLTQNISVILQKKG